MHVCLDSQEFLARYLALIQPLHFLAGQLAIISVLLVRPFNSFQSTVLFLVCSESPNWCKGLLCHCVFLHLSIILHVNTNLCLLTKEMNVSGLSEVE